MRGVHLLFAAFAFMQAGAPALAGSGAPLEGTFPSSFGQTARAPGSDTVDPQVVRDIMVWLSRNYDLPAGSAPPAVKFVSQRAMIALRSGGAPSGQGSALSPVKEGGPGSNSHPSDIVALYDDRRNIIFLTDDWSGSTPSELSVLVHEMVHHLQNLAGTEFPCPQAREELAYAAQRDWLALFGRDLLTEFEVDALTLLVRTRCGM